VKVWSGLNSLCIGSVARFHEHGNEISEFHKSREFLNPVNNINLLFKTYYGVSMSVNEYIVEVYSGLFRNIFVLPAETYLVRYLLKIFHGIMVRNKDNFDSVSSEVGRKSLTPRLIICLKLYVLVISTYDIPIFLLCVRNKK
jgi:hypothetical protein